MGFIKDIIFGGVSKGLDVAAVPLKKMSQLNDRDVTFQTFSRLQRESDGLNFHRKAEADALLTRYAEQFGVSVSELKAQGKAYRSNKLVRE